MLPGNNQSARASHGRARTRRCVALAALVGLVAAPGAADRRTRTPKGFKTYRSKYYVIHTDLGPDVAHEAALRLTAMAEEYHRRTRDFGGTIRHKLPFYLFRKEDDYHDAGGPPKSAGVFTGDKLMAVGGAHPGPGLWHTIQHEGFHQFARYAIRAPLPAWINEGLAEYFGEGLFTGDGFVVGVVPPWRLRALKENLRAGKGKSPRAAGAAGAGLRELMRMSYDDWNEDIDPTNYTRAWSMIHFLVHADNGRYARRLTRFINDTRRMRYETAWARNFGRDISAFEKKWREYWLAQPDNPTADLYARASVATLTSFLARAAAAGQAFDGLRPFVQAAIDGKLKMGKRDWLPLSLLGEALSRAPALGRWSLAKDDNGAMTLTLATPDGRTYTGAYVLQAGRVKDVRVTSAAPPATRPAATTRPG